MVTDSIRALRILSDWRLWGALLVTAVGLAAVESNQHWLPQGGQGRAIVKLSIYWGLWLVWPAIALIGIRLLVQVVRLRLFGALVSAMLLAVLGCMAWARFIEPNQLRVIETSVSTVCGVRVALVSDMHSGLFIRHDQLEGVVQALNAQDVNAVVVAGDWTYEPDLDLRAALAPFASLRHKTYAVLGNHDEASPGPRIRDPLIKTLTDMRIDVIHGRRVMLGRCELTGIGDLHSGRMERDLETLKGIKPLQPAARRVILTHDPDAQLHLPAGEAALMLAAHTHGGQINLPWLTDAMLARMGDGGFKRGLYDRPNMKVFVTSGTGTVKLPLRFRMPPTIDVLAL